MQFFRDRQLTWRHFAKLGFAVLFVQAVFWLIIDPNFIRTESGSFQPYQVEQMQIAQVESPDLNALGTAAFKDLDQSEPQRFQRGYYALRMAFSLETVPAEGLAILTRNDADNLQIYVNKSLFYGEGEMSLPEITYESAEANSTMHRIPAPMLREGSNIIETVLVFSANRDQAVGAPLIGNYKEVENAFSWRKFLINEVPLISITVGFVLTILVFFVMVRAEQKDFLLWFFVLIASWSMRNVFFSWSEIPLHGNARLLFYSLLTLTLSASWPMMVDAWCGTRTKLLRIVAIGTFSLASIASNYLLLISSDPTAFSIVEDILDNTGIFLIVVTLGRLFWHFATNLDERYWEAAFLVMLALLLAILLFNLMLYDRHPPYLRITQPLFLFAFVIAFVLRNFRLFQSSTQIAEMLQGKLDLREAELEAAHAREKQLLVKQAHSTERDRIMRDMHDGIGNSLVSMLMMAKQGTAKHSEYATKVQNVIDEMRLTIDSGETVGKSLQAVLSVFKKRIIPRAKDAGFSVEWNEGSTQEIVYLGPQEGLQIFRIMQEAFTNALKHSRGSKILVDVSYPDDDNREVGISVSDDGVGLSKVGASGYGVSNMRSRAKSIGGEIAIKADENGTTVTLKVPHSSKLQS